MGASTSTLVTSGSGMTQCPDMIGLDLASGRIRWRVPGEAEQVWIVGGRVIAQAGRVVDFPDSPGNHQPRVLLDDFGLSSRYQMIVDGRVVGIDLSARQLAAYS